MSTTLALAASQGMVDVPFVGQRASSDAEHRRSTATGKAKARHTISRRERATCDRTLIDRPRMRKRLAKLGYKKHGPTTYRRKLLRGKVQQFCLRMPKSKATRWVTDGLGKAVKTPAHTLSQITYPPLLTGAVKLDLPERLGVSSFQLLDAPAVARTSYQNGAVYTGTEFDVVYEGGVGQVKESIIVHHRQGQRTWRWKLRYTKGSAPTLTNQGAVQFGGKVVLERPIIFNRQGKKIASPRWFIKGDVVSFTVNDAKIALPYVIDPTADFPQRIYPDKVASAPITGAEDIRDPAPGPASSCTKLPIGTTGEAIFSSMIARPTNPGANIATANPSASVGGWALQDGTSFTTGQPSYSMAAPDDSTLYVVGNGGRVSKSSDGGCSWTRLTSGTTENLRSASAPSTSVIWVAGDNGAIRRSTDGGSTWSDRNTTGVSPNIRDIDAVDANTAMVVGPGRVVARTTTGGGAAWALVDQPGMDNDLRAVEMVDANVVWISGSPGKIYKTTDGAATWTSQGNMGAGINDISAVSATTAWAVGDGGAIFATTDGNTWSAQASGVMDNLNWVSAVNASVVWAGGNGGRLLFTANGGSSWSVMTPFGTQSHLGGAARSATVAWTSDAIGRVQRYYPNGATGSMGWVSSAVGGTTLSAGPWTVGGRVCREPYSTGVLNAGIRARVWKVRVDGAGNYTSAIAMTPWSAATSSTPIAAGACANLITTTTPLVRSMLASEHLYVEVATKVYGGQQANQTISLQVADINTYIDFSSPAADSTPLPTNLRTTSTISATGFTADATPTLRANLNDPDWYHHLEYEICRDAACTDVAATGTSTFGQELGSTTDSWTSPSLADGLYYIRVRTVEDTGESDTSSWTPINATTSANRCSVPNVGPCDKFNVDKTNPTPPTTVADGTTATDIDWTASASALSANWDAGTDANGILRYEYCMSTLNGCGGTIVQGWASTGAAQSITRAGLTLSNGQIYYTCVRAVDNAGNTGAATCSDGQTVDTQSPTATAGVRDGAATDQSLTNNGSQLVANWDGASDALSGLARYDVCFTTSSTGTNCAGAAISPWTSTGLVTNVTRTGLTLVHAATYYACVRSVDNVGNVSSTVCSNGIVVDLNGPTAPASVNDSTGADIDVQATAVGLAANWGGATDPSGIARYEICFSTSATAADCAGAATLAWTDMALATSTTQSLALSDATRYYTHVRAYDNAGNVGAVGSSDGVLVDTTAPGLAGIPRESAGADVDWWGSNSSWTSNWTAASDGAGGSGIARYDTCVTDKADGSDCALGAARTWTANVPPTGLSNTQTLLGLTESIMYYTCVRAADAAGNVGTSICSDGARIDTIDPSAPSGVLDGLGADIDVSSSATSASANWTASTDANGIATYEACITISSTGADCAGAAVRSWASTNSTVANTTLNGLTLANGSTYYFCVRAVDNSGRLSAASCSDNFVVDIGPPNAPATVNDGTAADIDWQTNATTINANWSTVTDPSGILRYEWCITTSNVGADCAGAAVQGWSSTGGATSQAQTGLTLTNGTRYYVCARAIDNGLNVGGEACSDGVTVDTIAPTTVASANDGSAADVDWQTSATSYQGNYASTSDTLSGLARYDVCLSTSATGADCAGAAVRSWASNASATSISLAALALGEGTTYYMHVRPVDVAGNIGAVTSTDGVRVDSVVPSDPSAINDGTATDIAFTPSLTTLSANWTGSTDVTSGVDRYDYCFTTSPTGATCATTAVATWAASGTATTVTRTGLSLVHASTYYACIRTYDVAGNVSATVCSNGVVVDALAPTVAAPVNDGTAADVDLQATSSQVSANWPASADPSGIADYDYCVSTSSTGADCGGVATVGWTANATTVVTHTGLALSEGVRYYVCVRATDGSGNTGAGTCSDGVVIDTVAPSTPATVNDGSGADLDYQTTATTLAANWTAATDATSSVTRYDVCISTLATGADCAGGATRTWTTLANVLTTNQTGLTLADGATYYYHVRAVDAIGNIGAHATSDGIMIDITAPLAPASVNDGAGIDQDIRNTGSTYDANWAAVADAQSGLARYDLCLSTSSTGTDCAGAATRPWTSMGTATSGTLSGLALANAGTYYGCVRAVDLAGNIGAVTCSDGVIIDLGPPPVPAFMRDGTAADVDAQASASAYDGNWASVTDASGIAYYEICISTSASGTDCAAAATRPWTNLGVTTATTQTGLTLVHGTTYYACVRATDNGANTGSATCSDGVLVDTQAPAAGTIADGAAADVDWLTVATTLRSNWTGFSDANTAIAAYSVCYSTLASGADCAAGALVTWTNVGAVTSDTRAAALAEGSTYYAHVRAADTVGNISTVATSDGATVDTIAPSAPAVSDSTGADIDMSSDGANYSANWTASTDATSGIADYSICLTTSSSGVDCAGAATRAWTSLGIATAHTFAGLTLANNVTYYACVRVRDVAGLTTTACSDGAIIDLLPPAPPATVNDGAAADIDRQGSSSTFSGNWTASTDATGIAYYEICITSSSTGADCAGAAARTWTNIGNVLTTAQAGLALTHATTYYICVRATDGTANTGALRCSDGSLIDTVAPTTGTVNDGSAADIDWQTTSASIRANWSGFADATTSIAGYQVCYSTSALGADCTAGALVTWAPAVGTTDTRTVALTEGATYYAHVRATDVVGNTSSHVSTDGFTVDTIAPTSPVVSDSAGADIDLSNVGSSYTANWNASVDTNSGIFEYMLCLTTSSTGAGCAAGALRPFASAGLSTTHTFAGLMLTSGTTYYGCVRVRDLAGNNSTTACSDGLTIDLGPPPNPTPINDGTAADIDRQGSGTSFSANWPAVTDPSGIDYYEICISASSTGSDCSGTAARPWTSAGNATTSTQAGLTLAHATIYYACIRATDNTANTSSGSCSDGALIDTVAPTAGTVSDGPGADLTWLASTTNIRSNWTGFADATTSIGGYQVCYSTDPTGSDCNAGALVVWTNVAGVSDSRAAALTEATTYYAHVRAIDVVGNISSTVSTNGQTVDTTAPTQPVIADGAGADIDISGVATSYTANWPASTELTSGMARYDVCLTTAFTGVNCGTTALRTWTNAGNVTTHTFAGLALVNGSTYYGCIRAYDNAGNFSTTRCSDGLTIDLGPPPAPTPLLDGSAGVDVDEQGDATSMSARWPAVTDASGIAGYELCISTSSTGADCAGAAESTWAAQGVTTAGTQGGLTMTHGTIYYACVRATDGSSNVGPAGCSDGVLIDLVGPSGGAVNDGVGADATWLSSASAISANWSGFADATTSVARYEVCWSADATGTDCAGAALVPWTSTTSTSRTQTGLTFVAGTTYYAHVRAFDRVGNVSAVVSSNGQTADNIAPSVPTPVEDGVGPDVDMVTDGTVYDGHWGASTDMESGLAGYEWCLTTSATGADCATSATITWTATAATSTSQTGLSLAYATTYYLCVRSLDIAGNSSAAGCSDGIIVDNMPPPAPTPIDGAGADIDYQQSLTNFAGNWPAVSDPSGIAQYEICFTYSSTGADCAAGALSVWASTGVALSGTATGLSVLDGATVYTCVRATDNNANTGSAGCSDGVMVDATSPAAPALVSDGTGADIDYQTSITSLAANWTAAADASAGVASHEICISTSAIGSDCAGAATLLWTTMGSGTSITRTGLTLTPGTIYYYHVRAIDRAGNVGAIASSDGNMPDNSNPGPTAEVRDSLGADQDITVSSTTIEANWDSASDALSGVSAYEMCITTNSIGTNCALASAVLTWTDVGNVLSTTRTGLTLSNATTYYVCIRSLDFASNRSSVRCSDGIELDIGPPVAPGWVRDGLGAIDEDSQGSATTVPARWAAVTDASGISYYEACLSTDPAGADCAGGALVTWQNVGNVTTYSFTGLALSHGDTVYTHVRATDGALNTGPSSASDGVTIDLQGPVMGAVRDGSTGDVDWLAPVSTLTGNWSAASDPAGISGYQMCMSTSATGADCAGAALAPWAAASTPGSRTGLTLVAGTTYYTHVRAIDAYGNVGVLSSSDGVAIDPAAPAATTAISPADGGSIGEGMLTFSWNAAVDADSGVASYSIYVDGALQATGITGTSWGTQAIYAGAHTWTIRAYDRVGNYSDSTFTFTATPVPDVTPPNAFNLLAPADNAAATGGTVLSWEPASDFHGISQYRLLVDGTLMATLTGSTTSFTLVGGGGSDLCLIDFEGGVVQAPGCVDMPTLQVPWTTGPNGGMALGAESLGLTNYDGRLTTTAATYSVNVPASGADLFFEHRWESHATLKADGTIQSAWDGGTVQISLDGGMTWKGTCLVNPTTTSNCEYAVVERAGGYNGQLATGGGITNETFKNSQVFTGTQNSWTSTRLNLQKDLRLVNRNIMVRFVQIMDTCHTGMSASQLAYCPAGVKNADWYIDNIRLTAPGITPGAHTWTVEAIDPSGNVRTANQTWNFTFS